MFAILTMIDGTQKMKFTSKRCRVSSSLAGKEASIASSNTICEPFKCINPFLYFRQGRLQITTEQTVAYIQICLPALLLTVLYPIEGAHAAGKSKGAAAGKKKKQARQTEKGAGSAPGAPCY